MEDNSVSTEEISQEITATGEGLLDVHNQDHLQVLKKSDSLHNFEPMGEWTAKAQANGKEMPVVAEIKAQDEDQLSHEDDPDISIEASNKEKAVAEEKPIQDAEAAAYIGESTEEMQMICMLQEGSAKKFDQTEHEIVTQHEEKDNKSSRDGTSKREHEGEKQLIAEVLEQSHKDLHEVPKVKELEEEATVVTRGSGPDQMASDENSCGCTTQLKMETETEATEAQASGGNCSTPLSDELKSKTAEVPEDPHKESSVVCKIEEAELIPVEHATETQEDPFAISTIEALDLQDPSELASDSIKDLSENVTDAILDDKTDLQAPKDKYTAYIIDQDKALSTFIGTEETISLATTDIPCDQNPIELIEEEEAVASSAPMLSSKIEEHRNFTDSGAEPKLEAKIAVAEKNLVENLQPEFATEKEAKEPGLLEDSLCPRVDKIKVELLEERERKDDASTLPEKDVAEFDSIIFNDTTRNNLDPECMTELIAEQLQVQSKEEHEKINEDSGQESQVAGAMTYNEYEIDPECKLATADIHNAQVDEDSTSFSSNETELQVPKFPNGLEVKESRQVEVRNEESLTEHVQEKSQGITLKERIGKLPLETDMVVATRDIQTDQDEDFQGSGLVYPQIEETIVRSESETPLEKKHEQAECEHETNLYNDEKLQSDNSGGEDRPHCTTSEKEYLTKLMPEQSESTLDEGQGEQQLELDVVEATELDSSTGLEQEDKPYEVQEFHCENLRSSYLVDEHETVESIEPDKGPSDLLLHTQSEEREKPTFCLANEHHHTGADEATLTEHVQENLENELEEEHRNLVLDLASVVDEASELAVTEALQESSASELLQSSQTIEESQNEQDGSIDVSSMSCEAHPVVTRVDLPEIEHTSVTSEVEAPEPQEHGNLEQEQDLGSSILVDEHETEESMKPDTGTPDSLVLHAHIEERVEPILGLGDELHPTGVNEELLNAPQEEQENLGLESAEDVFKSSEVGVVTEALKDSSTSELEHEKLHQDHENNWYNAQELQDEDLESSTLVDKYETEASLELGKADPDSILLQTEIQKLQSDLEELLDLGGVIEPLEESLTLQVLETKPIIGDGLTAPLLVQEDEKIGCEEEYKHEPEEVTLKSFPVDELQEQPHFEESNDESIDTIKAPLAQEPEELGLSLQKVHLKSIPVEELHEHPQVEEGNDKLSNTMKAPVAHEPEELGFLVQTDELKSIQVDELQEQPQIEEGNDESTNTPVAHEPEKSSLLIKEVDLKCIPVDELQEQPQVQEFNNKSISMIKAPAAHEPEESGLSLKEELKTIPVDELQEQSQVEEDHDELINTPVAHVPEESGLSFKAVDLKSIPAEELQQQPQAEEDDEESIGAIKAPVAYEPEQSDLSIKEVNLKFNMDEIQEQPLVEESNDELIHRLVLHEPEESGRLSLKEVDLKSVSVKNLQEEANNESFGRITHEPEESGLLLEKVTLKSFPVEEQRHFEEGNDESIDTIKAPVAQEPEESGLSLQKVHLTSISVEELEEHLQVEEVNDKSINTIKAPVAHEPEELGLLVKADELKSIQVDELQEQLQIDEGNDESITTPVVHEPEKSSPLLKEVDLECMSVDELQEQPQVEESNNESISMIKAPVAHEPEESGLSLKEQLKTTPVDELQEQSQDEENHDESINTPVAHVPEDESTNTPVAHVPEVSGLSFEALDLKSILAEELQQQPQAEKEDDESIGAIKAPVVYEPEESELSIKEVNLKSILMDELQEQPLVEECNDELIHRLVLHEPEESGLSLREVDLKSVSEANNESFGRIAHEPEESGLLLEKVTLKSFPVEEQPHFEESDDESIDTIKAPVAQEPEESGLSLQKVHLTSISVEELEEHLQVEEVNDKSINTIKAPVAHEPEELGLLVKADELKSIQVDELQEQPQIDEGNDESINTPVVHEPEKSSPLLKEVDLECMSVDELQEQPQVEESNNESISMIKAPVAHEPEESGLSLKEQLKTTPVDEVQEQSQDEEDHDESINTPVAHVPEDESTNTPVAHVPEETGLSFEALDLKSILAEELQQQPQAEKEDDESIGAIKAPVAYAPEESDLSIKEVNLKSILMDELQEQPLAEECNDELIHRLVLHEPEESGLSLREVDLKSVSVKHLQEEANNESFGRITHEPEESGLLLEEVTLKSYPVDDLQEPPHFEESNDESINIINAPVAQEPEEIGLSLQKVHLKSIPVEELQEHPHESKAPVAHEPEKLGLLEKADELKSIQVHELQEQPQMEEGNDVATNTPVAHESEKLSLLLKDVDLECIPVDELQEQPQVEESLAHEPEELGLLSKEVDLKSIVVDELPEQTQVEKGKDESIRTPVAHEPEESGLLLREVDLKSILVDELQGQPQVEEANNESIETLMADEPEESGPSPKEVDPKLTPVDEFQEQASVIEANDVETIVADEPEKSGPSSKEVDLKLTLVDELQKEPSVEEVADESIDTIKAAVAVAHESEESGLSLKEVDLKSILVDELPKQRQVEEGNDESADTIKAPVTLEPEESGHLTKEVELKSIPVDELPKWPQVEEGDDELIDTIKAPEAHEPEESGPSIREVKAIPVDEYPEQPQVEEDNDEPIHSLVVHEIEEFDLSIKKVDLKSSLVDEFQEPQVDRSIHTIKAPVAHESEEPGQGQDQSNYADAEFLSKDNQNVGQVDLMEKEETEFYCECSHDIIVESSEELWLANQASSQSAIEESGRGFTEEEQITNSSKLHTTSEKPRADIQVTSADTDLDEQFEDAINEDKQPTSEEEDPLIDYVSTNNLRLLDKDEQEEIFAERAFDQQRDIDMSDSGGQNNSDREATAPDNIKVGGLRTTELSTALVTPWVAETKSEAPLSLENESSELLTKGDIKPAIELKATAEKQVLNTKEKTLLHSFNVEGEKEIGVEKVQSVKPRSPSTSAYQNIKTQDKSRQKVPMPENTQSAQIDSQRQQNKQSQNKKKKGRGGRRKDKLGWS